MRGLLYISDHEEIIPMVKAIVICGLLFAASVAVSGCSNTHEAASCRGTTVQANVGKWVMEDVR